MVICAGISFLACCVPPPVDIEIDETTDVFVPTTPADSPASHLLCHLQLPLQTRNFLLQIALSFLTDLCFLSGCPFRQISILVLAAAAVAAAALAVHVDSTLHGIIVIVFAHAAA